MSRIRKKSFKEGLVPRFLMERAFAEQLELDPEIAAEIARVNDEFGAPMAVSLPQRHKRKTYCLYEAPSADAIRAAAQWLNVPVDAIIEVTESRPEQYA
jgi:Protein of unknown function (DUF4242)